MSKKYFIAGGAGFIGSTLVHRILEREPDSKIIVYDNFSSGTRALLDNIKMKQRLKIIDGDIKNLEFLTHSMCGCDVVYHFASNADISKAMSDPTIDFWEGTFLTQNILEAMRINKIKKIIYASGSGVYGDKDFETLTESSSPLLPTSPYGASKLAGEALISAYSHLFDIKARIYRFANVIGGNQTHGIISDLIYKLKKNSGELKVLGNGKQSKTYVYVLDILNAIALTCGGEEMYCCYNVSTESNILVQDIVKLILEGMDLEEKTNVLYGDTLGGWKGDVPIVFLSAEKIRKKGWKYIYNSEEAVIKTIKEILEAKR